MSWLIAYMSLVNDSFKSLAILLSGHIAHVSAKSLQESSEYPSMTDFKAQIMTLVICPEFTIFGSKVFWIEHVEREVGWFITLNLLKFSVLAILLFLKNYYS